MILPISCNSLLSDLFFPLPYISSLTYLFFYLVFCVSILFIVYLLPFQTMLNFGFSPLAFDSKVFNIPRRFVCRVLLRILVQVMELPVHHMKLRLSEQISNAPCLGGSPLTLLTMFSTVFVYWMVQLCVCMMMLAFMTLIDSFLCSECWCIVGLIFAMTSDA
jgi:hypothetical protein